MVVSRNLDSMSQSRSQANNMCTSSYQIYKIWSLTKNSRPVKTRSVLYKSADQVKTEPYESKVKNARTESNNSKVKVQDPPLYKT